MENRTGRELVSRRKAITSLATFAGAAAVLLAASPARADDPEIIVYDGFSDLLTDNAGSILADASYFLGLAATTPIGYVRCVLVVDNQVVRYLDPEAEITNYSQPINPTFEIDWTYPLPTTSGYHEIEFKATTEGRSNTIGNPTDVLFDIFYNYTV